MIVQCVSTAKFKQLLTIIQLHPVTGLLALSRLISIFVFGLNISPLTQEITHSTYHEKSSNISYTVSGHDRLPEPQACKHLLVGKG